LPTEDPNTAARLRRDVDRLSAELAQLESAVEALRSGADRTPASLAAGAEEKLDADGELATLSPKARDQVRDVLSQEFQRQADERKAKQAEQDKASAQRRAERTATNLKLNAADTQKLADFYLEANQKRREIFTNMQGANADRQSRRDGFQAMLDWQIAELTKQFGADLAGQIQAADRPGRGGRGQGGGRGGRSQGNSPTDGGAQKQ
jgi:chromosome segregation ATPase